MEEADLITVNIGSNDILGNPLGQAMREMYNTDGVDKAILDAIKAELQKTGDFGTALLKLIGYAESIGQGTKLLVSLAYYMNIAYQQFTENWDAIVKNIYRLNPDVTLVAVGMHNAFANTSLTVGSVIKTGKLLQPIMDKMNPWMQTGSACAGCRVRRACVHAGRFLDGVSPGRAPHGGRPPLHCRPHPLRAPGHGAVV